MTNNVMTFSVLNMKCAGCVAAVEKAVNTLSEVEEVTVSLDSHQAVVKSTASTDEIIKVITDAGFPASLV